MSFHQQSSFFLTASPLCNPNQLVLDTSCGKCTYSLEGKQIIIRTLENRQIFIQTIMSAGFKDNGKEYNENKIVTSHAKTFLVVCGFQRIAICMPCISHSNGLGGPIIQTAWAIRAKKNCIHLHWMVSHHYFDCIRSKISVSRQLYIRLTASVQKFSSSVHLFDCSHAKILFIRASILLFHFELLGSPFLISMLAVHSLAICSFLRNVFEGEVTV